MENETPEVTRAISEKEAIRKELQVTIHPIDALRTYKYVVICALYRGQYVLSRHKDRDTWETQGGHIEAGESPLDAARRELFEEAGIRDADLYEVCDYYGYNSKSHSNGRVFLAVVHTLDRLPDFEMREVGVFDALPAALTYPQATPVLFAQAKRFAKDAEDAGGAAKETF